MDGMTVRALRGAGLAVAMTCASLALAGPATAGAAPYFASLPLDPDAPVPGDHGDLALNVPAPPYPVGTGPAVAPGNGGLMARFGDPVDPVAARDGIVLAGGGEPVPFSDEPDATAALGGVSGAPAAGPGGEGSSGAPDGVTTVMEGEAAPPEEPDGKLIETGKASWYQHDGIAADGERFDPDRLTAAHGELPLGTRVKVVNMENRRSVTVEITDRTNDRTKEKRDYVIDLSRAAAERIGIKGLKTVALYRAD